MPTKLLEQLERADCGAKCTGAVAIRNHVDRNAGLLFALNRHAGTDLVDEPLPELVCRFEHASADDQRIGIEGVDHLVEEETQCVRLNLEDFAAHLVALGCEPASGV